MCGKRLYVAALSSVCDDYSYNKLTATAASDSISFCHLYCTTYILTAHIQNKCLKRLLLVDDDYILAG